MISGLLAASASFLVTLCTCGLIRRGAGRIGFCDVPGTEAHKGHARAVPYGGGIGIMSGLLVGLITTWALGALNLARILEFLPMALGAGGLFLLGLVDDRWNLPARRKLLLQTMIILGALCWIDPTIDFLHAWPWLSLSVGILWCLLITNAYNLLDHADGLSSVIASISLVLLMSAALLAGDAYQARAASLLIASLVGFLVWNAPPARLYMGDAGSLPLGFLLAVGALEVTFWESDSGHGSSLAVLAPVLVSAIPLYDTSVVIVKRLRRHRPLMHGDRNHISHRLTRLGLSPRLSLLVVGALQAALASSAVLLPRLALTLGLVVIAQGLCLVIVAILLEAGRDHGDPHAEIPRR